MQLSNMNLGLNRRSGGGAPNVSKAEQAFAYKKPWLNGATVLDQRSGLGTDRDQQPGRAYLFDGVDDYVEIPAGSAVASDHSGSVRFSAVDPTIANQTILGVTNSVVDRFGIAVSTSTIRVTAYDGSNHSASAALTDSDWHLLTWDWDAGTSTMAGSLDGVAMVGTLGVATSSVSGKKIGAASSGGLLFAGKISDLVLLDVAQYKCDDSHPTVAYDSSGNGNDGTKTNITVSSFHHEGNDVPYSWQNEVGYSTGLIPRDESNPTKDVTGSALTYTGKAQRNGELVNSNCATFDGVDDKIDFGDSSEFQLSPSDTWEFSCRFNAGTTTWADTLFDLGGNTNYWIALDGGVNSIWVFTKGTSPTIISANDSWVTGQWHDCRVVFDGVDTKVFVDGIEVATSSTLPTQTSSGATLYFGARTSSYYFDGSVCNAKFIKNGTTLVDAPLAEGAGVTIYDVSGNGNDGTVNNITVASFWGTLQNVYHRNIESGFRLASGVKIPALNDGSQAADGNAITNPAKVGHNGAETQINFNLEPDAPWTRDQTLETDYEFGDGRTAPNHVEQTSILENKFRTEIA